jgi:CheY-like chemotaxis protein
VPPAITSPISSPHFDESAPSRILIIDDNPRIHHDFDLVLLEELENPELDSDEQRLYGLAARPVNPRVEYLLEHALSGQEGVNRVGEGLAEGRFYQLAFVDIRMPGMDGVETITHVWRLDPNIQVVICTAYADYSQEDLVSRLGHTDKLLVLKKPFDNIEVTQLARTLTRKWHLARQAALKLEQMELLVSQRTRQILEMQRYQAPRFGTPPPVAAAEVPAPPEKIADAESTEAKMPLILLIENDPELGLRLKQSLGRDYRIVEALDDREGRLKAQELVPDLIIADISSPQVDGIHLCQRIKRAQLTSHIPVILLNNGESGDRQLKALETGADDYILMPFNHSLLKVRVDNLLASRRNLRASFNQQTGLQPRDLAVNQADARFLQRALAAIEQNLSDFEFDVEALARNVAVSRRQLFRKLKAVVDLSPKALIRSVRLKRAGQLLRESEMTVTEITFAVGFQDVKHFRSLFKEQFGVLPSEYLKTVLPTII